MNTPEASCVDSPFETLPNELELYILHWCHAAITRLVCRHWRDSVSPARPRLADHLHDLHVAMWVHDTYRRVDHKGCSEYIAVHGDMVALRWLYAVAPGAARYNMYHVCSLAMLERHFHIAKWYIKKMLGYVDAHFLIAAAGDDHVMLAWALKFAAKREQTHTMSPYTLCYTACMYGNERSLQTLLDYGIKPGDNAYLQAVRADSPSMLHMLHKVRTVPPVALEAIQPETHCYWWAVETGLLQTVQS